MKLALQSVSIAATIIFLIFTAKLYLLAPDKHSTVVPTVSLTATSECNLLESRCLFSAGHRQVFLTLSGDVRTMKAFTLKAEMVGFNSEIKQVSARFLMQSMNMGVNTFRLLKAEKIANSHFWQATILLPVCVSKRTDWIMQFQLIADDKMYQALVPLQIK